MKEADFAVKDGNCFGLVSEFNPFHNGHKALCKKAKAAGAEYILAVMSGNFVQRGSFAVADKWTRARAALSGGVDLVIELPLPYATATAQKFAYGAVRLLRDCGCVDGLCFGSELGEAPPLLRASKVIDDESVQIELRKYLAQGLTYAKARQMAVEAVFGEESSALLTSPNNILAIEYLRQSEKLGWNPKIFTVKRLGTSHDSGETNGSFASASWLRNHFPAEWKSYVPQEAYVVYQKAEQDGLLPADISKMETAILSHLRRLGKEELARLPDLSEGLEGRLYTSIRTATDLTELEESLKTKRYTMTRIRRLILSAYLEITADYMETPPPYIRVLGFTKEGAELLKKMKRSAALPVHTSLLRLSGQGEQCARFAGLEASSGDLYALSLPRPSKCGWEYSSSGVFLSKC